MAVNYPSSEPLSLGKLVHLEQLKSIVENALEDGKSSTAQVDRYKSPFWSDN